MSTTGDDHLRWLEVPVGIEKRSGCLENEGHHRGLEGSGGFGIFSQEFQNTERIVSLVLCSVSDVADLYPWFSK